MDDAPPPSSSGGSKPKAWKHIGLYGHAVGTFAVDPSAVAWKSAAGVDDVETRRVVPAHRIAGAAWTVFGKSGHLRLLIKKEGKDKAEGGGGSAKLPSALRFDGFPANEYDVLSDAFKAHYGIALKRHAMSSGGSSWGNADVRDSHLVFRRCVLEDADEEGEEYEPRDGDEMLSLNLAEVSQCVLPGNNRNEIEMQFLESDTVEAGTDQLVAIRFYVPPDADADPADKEAPTSAESLQSRILKTASVRSASGAVIAEFDESKGTFLTPRGRYSVELYDGFLRMRGAKYDYKIRYDDVSRLFLLPKQDDVHMAFVIALDKPIRQGQQRYNMLVMQCTKEHSELDINLDDATLEKEYGGDLQPHMTGSFSNLVAKTFKVITKKKVFIPGKFATANHNACVKCALRANEGHLYPLEKQFIFIHKPAVLIRFDEIESVEFQRYAGGQVTTRNFDLCVTLRSTPGDTLSTKEYIFSGIDKSNFKPLYSFLKGKKIRLMNIEEVSGEGPSAAGPPAYNEMDDGGDGSESSEDEDYDQDNKSEESSSESDEDDDDMGSVASDDSDLAEHRKKAAPDAAVPKKSKGKKEKKKSKESSSAKGKKRKESSSPAKAASQKKKKKKDPNAPKKPMSSFMFFSTAKRKEVKANNPDAAFGDIARLVSDLWKQVDGDRKVLWEDKAEKDKARYKKEMERYTPPPDSEDTDDSDDDAKGKKPKAKRAKKDPNAPKRPMNAYMLYSNSIRAKVREENPDLAMGAIAKEIGTRYKALSADENAKWQAKAEKAKEVYKEVMAEYEKTKRGEESTSKKSKGKAAEGKKKKKKKAPEPDPSSSSEEESADVDNSDGSDDSDSDSDSD